MKLTEINIRDPFVVKEDSAYYLYGTRAKHFGRRTGGFDVYTSADLQNWNGPTECFNSENAHLNRDVNWAPEVHRYKDSYYLFATFTRANGLRGVFVLKADTPLGPFYEYSLGPVTPESWECLDGTLYVSCEATPYLVFCHEHTQIKDGTICYLKLSDDLKTAISEPTMLFCGSSPYWVKHKRIFKHYITDGPFIYRTSGGRLLMLWSTFIKKNYVLAVAQSDNDEIDGNFFHLPPLVTNDGGHGMIFRAGENHLMLTYHTPNQTNHERPVFKELLDTGNGIELLLHSDELL